MLQISDNVDPDPLAGVLRYLTSSVFAADFAITFYAHLTAGVSSVLIAHTFVDAASSSGLRRRNYVL